MVGAMRSSESLHNCIVNPQQEKAKSKCDFAPKKRGRKAAKVPSSRHFEILLATKTQTYEQVGAAHDISRQRVGQIAQRWKEYLPVRPLQSREVIKNGCGDQPPRKKEKRIHIVSFRLTEAEVELLQHRYPEAKSVDRAARGVMTRALLI